ncbi:MAG: GTP-binding protein [Candidatus Lokiarchaeota archaeon]|nr:GTP-binding protein [Candidatus Lokiarchaeota archaeon]
MSLQTFILKVVVGGAGGVGKTTLLHRYLHGLFKEDTTMTIGVSFVSKEVSRPNAKIKLSLWDLGGQDRFRFLQKSYIQGARAGVVFFDMTRLDTMLQVKEWVKMFRDGVSPQMPIVLAGGKYDIVDPDMLSDVNDYAKEVVEQLNLSAYFTTSSKNGLNVDELFNHVVDTVLFQPPQEKSTAATTTE